MEKIRENAYVFSADMMSNLCKFDGGESSKRDASLNLVSLRIQHAQEKNGELFALRIRHRLESALNFHSTLSVSGVQSASQRR